MRLELCKSRSSFISKAFEGQLIEVLWPTEANPAPGWEKRQENRRRGRLALARGTSVVARVVFENGSSVELPPKTFWYQPKGDK